MFLFLVGFFLGWLAFGLACLLSVAFIRWSQRRYEEDAKRMVIDA
jgi:hypothetical protein